MMVKKKLSNDDEELYRNLIEDVSDSD